MSKTKVPVEVQEHRKARGLHPETGRPIYDPTPMAPPIGYKKQPSIFDQVRQAIRQERLAELEQLEETLDQVDDYEITDDPPDPASRWENDWEPTVAELRQMIEDKKESLAARTAAEQEKLRSAAPSGAREAGDQGARGAAPAKEKSGGTSGTPGFE